LFKPTQIILWVVLPLVPAAFAFYRRFATEQRGLWFFDANTSISFAVVLFILLVSVRLHKWSISIREKFLAFGLTFQLPISLLSFLGGPSEGFAWAMEARRVIEEDGGLQAAIGILQGFSGLYVYFLGIRIGKRLDPRNQDFLSQSLRALGGMVSFFSVIMALAIFSVQAPYELFWPLRSILLASGFLLGIIAMATGVVHGIERDAIMMFLGVAFNFSVSFILGAAAIPLTRIGSTVFPAMAAFIMNTMIMLGLLSYIIHHNIGPIAGIFRFVFAKL